jgi:hypothetical protein
VGSTFILRARKGQEAIRSHHQAMKEIEAQVERLPKLGKWFVDIHGGRLRLG